MRIDLLHVRKQFDRTVALKDAVLTVEPGERVGLVGPNGSGKSTLIRVLMGIIDFEGKATIDGLHPLRDRAALAPRMAYVPQIAPRLAAPVNELVRAVASVRDCDVQVVRDTARQLDLDLDTFATKPFRDLSGGTKQKLLLALALAKPAELYVLDEPTASLDATARARFFDLYESVAGKATLLLCTHRDDEMSRLAERVVTLADGVVTSSEPVRAASPAPEAPAAASPRRLHVVNGGRHG
jgi:ABC-2 type transport system ATP-binding protein